MQLFLYNTTKRTFFEDHSSFFLFFHGCLNSFSFCASLSSISSLRILPFGFIGQVDSYIWEHSIFSGFQEIYAMCWPCFSFFSDFVFHDLPLVCCFAVLVLFLLFLLSVSLRESPLPLSFLMHMLYYILWSTSSSSSSSWFS